MAETNFTTRGRLKVKRENTWPVLFEHAITMIEREVNEYELLEFNAEVNQTDDGKVYVWRAEGKIL